jgi:acyl carrier protein
MATREQIRAALQDILGAIAPEADFDAIAPDKLLRDQLDIDSYDFLNVVIRLHETLGVDIPETDYGKLATLNGTLDYLVARSAGKT